MRYVIIGGSAAGISAARAIRANDENGEIVIVEKESTLYFRSLIPGLIDGSIAEEVVIQPRNFFGEHRITLYSGKEVASIDAKEKQVVLTSNEKISYDKLLISTGSSAILPQIPGIEATGVFTLHTLDDAKKIKEAARDAQRAVIVGGGRVGLRAAFALHHLRLQVTIVGKSPHILPLMLDSAAAGIISNAIKQQGLTIINGVDVKEIIIKNGKVSDVTLETGERLRAELVIVGKGVRPNIELARKAGINTDRGILVNERMETSIADIYAAGDAAEVNDVVTGERIVSGVWTNAAEMGRCAGHNMAGVRREYLGAFGLLNSMEIAGIPIISVGVIRPNGNGYEVITAQRGDTYRKLVFKNNKLVGAILIGNIEGAGVYTALIKRRADVSKLREQMARKLLSYAYLVNYRAPALEPYLKGAI